MRSALSPSICDPLLTSASATKSSVKNTTEIGVEKAVKRIKGVGEEGYRWRQEFNHNLLDRFSTYIYGFTWEDPAVDLM